MAIADADMAPPGAPAPPPPPVCFAEPANDPPRKSLPLSLDASELPNEAVAGEDAVPPRNDPLAAEDAVENAIEWVVWRVGTVTPPPTPPPRAAMEDTACCNGGAARKGTSSTDDTDNAAAPWAATLGAGSVARVQAASSSMV